MIRVVELFAGVGGFRLGLEQASNEFKTVWFNQWEPNKQKQWAWECYTQHFGTCDNSNVDINRVNKKNIPDFDLLVAGFPCQNYSIAASTKSARGLEGEKGVLWWDIYEILKTKNPRYCLFENVDRLLKSPSKQKGRDFGVILYCLKSLDYNVEWRVITASNYGGHQRRKRTFIFACKKNFNPFFNEIFSVNQKRNQLFKTSIELSDDIQNFTFDFHNWGVMKNGSIHSENVVENQEDFKTLRDVLVLNAKSIYYLNEDQIKRFKYLKKNKSIVRTTKDGHEWIYSEGAMSFPDFLNRPSRTMLTSEGTVNRCSHVIDDNGLRFLTPIECERLNGFPDNWTENMPDRMRYFCMGNALVVSLVEKIGRKIIEIDRTL